MRLTDLEVRNLPLPAKGQKLYRDDSLPGFACRVSQGGTRTFILVHGRDRQFLTLGRYPIISLSEARTEAKKFLAEKTLGKVRPRSLEFAQAVELFLDEKRKAKRERTVSGYDYYLKRLRFRGQLSEVSHADVQRKLEKLKTPGTYNHALAALRGFFNWAHKRRYISDNPVVGFSEIARPARSRVLTDKELKSIYLACENNRSDIPERFRTIVRLLILTGQRRGEVAALKRSYIAAESCTLPATLTKNGREHTFPLGKLARALLKDEKDVDGYLFPARGKAPRPFNGWSKAKAQLDEESGISDWTLHDLRRTFATRLAEMGTPIHVVEKLLNHITGTTGGLVAVYQRHQYWPEQVAAIEAWDKRLLRIIGR